MQIFVKTLNGQTIAFDVEKEYLIVDIKNKIEDRQGIPSNQQRLIFRGKQLEDEKTLQEYSIHKDSTLHLIMKQGFDPNLKEVQPTSFYPTINQFISTNLDEINVVIPFSKIGSKRIIPEPMSSNPEYIDDHDIFRQQLPLPILKKGHQEMKDISIFLIDTFDIPYREENDIRHLFSKIDEPVVSYKEIEVYSFYIQEIFDEINLAITPINDYSLVTIYFIPFFIKQNEIEDLQNILKEYEYYIYSKNPHQEIDETLLSNTDKKELIDWHKGQNGGVRKRRKRSNKRKTTKKKRTSRKKK